MPLTKRKPESSRTLIDAPAQDPPGISATVEVRGVSKRFDNGVTALEDLSMSIAPGEVVSIVGPSGCGKSTFLRLIAGLHAPSSGSIVVGGTPVTAPRQDVGMMFQKPTLLPWKTATENVLLPRRLGRRVGPAEKREAARLLELVGLAGFEHHYPAHLSGGMEQRVALARLLIMGVDVILLDEPFAAVDELTRERLNQEFLQIHSRIGATVVLVTHNIEEAVFVADRVIVLAPHPGRLADIVDVGLPRPRGREHTRTTEFQELVFRVREVLERIDDRADLEATR